MILTVASGDCDNTMHYYHEQKLVAVVIDHPLDLTRSIVFDAGLEEIWADIRTGNMDDCADAIRHHLESAVPTSER